eukprot:6662361-Ditylum_brightwellii.AAC.2
MGTETLAYLAGRIHEKIDVYQGDKNRSIPGHLQKRKKNLQKARKNSYKDRESRQLTEAAKGSGMMFRIKKS